MSGSLVASHRISIDVFELRSRIAGLVCSDPWLEVCWEAVCFGGTAAGERPEAYLERNAIYPPGGRRKRGMRRCVECGGRWCPPYYVAEEGAVCVDCSVGHGLVVTDEKTHVSSTSSPTAVALERMESLRIRLVESRLAAEDEASLMGEIADYKRYRNRFIADASNTK